MLLQERGTQLEQQQPRLGQRLARALADLTEILQGGWYIALRESSRARSRPVDSAALSLPMNTPAEMTEAANRTS